MGVVFVDGFDWVDVVKKSGVFLMKINWIDIFLIVFGLFLAYQMILYLLGGSWAVDALSLGVLFLIAGLLWRVSLDLAKLNMRFDGHINWHARNK